MKEQQAAKAEAEEATSSCEVEGVVSGVAQLFDIFSECSSSAGVIEVGTQTEGGEVFELYEALWRSTSGESLRHG